MAFKCWTIIHLFVLVVLLIEKTLGHGRLIEPPSRYGFDTPHNYNDHELYCGGYAVQWNKNGGKCGECGDSFSLPEPRPHEYGGKWGQGVIVRNYKIASQMTIRVELTASHFGYFEFRLCDNVAAKQDCLDKHIMKILSGVPSMPQPNDLDTRFYPRNGSRIYEIRAQLPADFKCKHCVLQWRYVAGNNWGTCEDGHGAVGCGPQEEFRACADISIGEYKGQQTRPSKPSIKPKPSIPSTDEPVVKPAPGTNNEIPTGSPYFGLSVAILSLFLVLCGFVAIYIYQYHGKRFKLFMKWNQNKKTCKPELPPVPPPRNRARNTTKLDPITPSIIIGTDNNLDSNS